jgi:hypothetical protein
MNNTTNTAVSYVPGAVISAAISNHVYTIPTVKLSGAALIEHTTKYPELFPSKTDLVAASGHVRNDGKVAFVSFYETLLAAKLEADPNYYVTIEEARDEDKEYDALSLPLQELYDEVHERFGEKWGHTMILDFIQELNDLGINDTNALDNAFYTVMDDTYHWERQFTEEYINELESLQDSLIYHAIDWQAVWDHQLTYDFYTIEFDDQVFVFHANY